MNALHAAERAGRSTPKRGFLVRLWRGHEEGLLYVVAAVLYIPGGVFLKTAFLNWLVGILFPLTVVYLAPQWIRRWRSNTPGADLGVGS
jgi:hypothetical protein